MPTKSKDLIEIEEQVAELPADERDRVQAYADALRAFLKRGGKFALVAFALVGQEVADDIEVKDG